MTQPVVEESGDGLGVGVFAGVLAAEAAFTIAVLAAYAAWLSELSATIFSALPLNPAIVWSLVPRWNNQVRELMRDLEAIAKTGWEDAAAQLGLDTPFDITNPVVQDQLRRTRNFMTQTPDEVYRMIIRVLDEFPGDQAAQERAVENILDITGTVNWPARAKTVAVTEVHRAFNFGSLAAAMNVGRGVTKRWDSKDDAATRPAHTRADGQTRPVFQAFIVGGEALQAPGDPAGSAWNVIQCRCKLSYLRRRDGR